MRLQPDGSNTADRENAGDTRRLQDILHGQREGAKEGRLGAEAGLPEEVTFSTLPNEILGEILKNLLDLPVRDAAKAVAQLSGVNKQLNAVALERLAAYPEVSRDMTHWFYSREKTVKNLEWNFQHAPHVLIDADEPAVLDHLAEISPLSIKETVQSITLRLHLDMFDASDPSELDAINGKIRAAYDNVSSHGHSELKIAIEVYGSDTGAGPDQSVVNYVWPRLMSILKTSDGKIQTSDGKGRLERLKVDCRELPSVSGIVEVVKRANNVIREIDLGRTRIDYAPMESLLYACGHETSQVRTLIARWAVVGSESLSAVLENKNNKLKELDVLLAFNTTVMRVLNGMESEHCQLERIRLDLANGLLPSDAHEFGARLVRSLKASTKELELSGSTEGDKLVMGLVETLPEAGPAFKTLTLRRMRLTLDAVEHLAAAIERGNGSLRELNLRYCYLDLASIMRLLNVATSPGCSLTAIDLSHNEETGGLDMAEVRTLQARRPDLHITFDNYETPS
jgi:hypothetical protein